MFLSVSLIFFLFIILCKSAFKKQNHYRPVFYTLFQKEKNKMCLFFSKKIMKNNHKLNELKIISFFSSLVILCKDFQNSIHIRK